MLPIRGFAVALLIMAGALGASARTTSGNGTVGLRAEVAPVLAFQIPAPGIAAEGVVAEVSQVAADSIVVQMHIVGNGVAQTIRIPVAVVSNVPDFLFRATAATGGAECAVQLSSNAGSLISRKFAASGNPFFGMALQQPVHDRTRPMVVEIEIEIEAVPEGESRDARMVIDLVRSR